MLWLVITAPSLNGDAVALLNRPPKTHQPVHPRTRTETVCLNIP
jgi:hypothetical protein